ncbi:MAG: hypothetical protein ACKVS9_17515, partial [Phycisphaerae bacterium]
MAEQILRFLQRSRICDVNNVPRVTSCPQGSIRAESLAKERAFNVHLCKHAARRGVEQPDVIRRRHVEPRTIGTDRHSKFGMRWQRYINTSDLLASADVPGCRMRNRR